MNYNFGRTRLNELSQEKILKELECAAKHFKYVTFGKRDFDKIAEISSSAVIKRFNGSWTKALEVLKKHLQEKGLDLLPRPHASNRIHSNKNLFDEMGRIWNIVGQRPSRTEWEMSKPKISYNCYKQRFGGWVNACNKFIEYKMEEEIPTDNLIHSECENLKTTQKIKINYKKENSRNISLSLRLKILNRDNFRCVFCGKSPATDLGTKLHIDHINPFSKGGKSTLENLQTLCAECNLGKGDNEKIGL